MLRTEQQMGLLANGKERTLQEMVDVALSGGWRVTEVVRKPEGSIIGRVIAVPTQIPPSAT